MERELHECGDDDDDDTLDVVEVEKNTSKSLSTEIDCNLRSTQSTYFRGFVCFWVFSFAPIEFVSKCLKTLNKS